MEAALLDRLRSIVGPPNVLTGVPLSPYAVEGRMPEAAVFPGGLEEVRAVIAVAAEVGAPVVPWGGGTAVGVGRPSGAAGLVLGLGRLNALVEHEPGDLTATVQAGMTVAALHDALGAREQWLSLDPPDRERATVGGVIATNAAGPRRHLYGTARDLLIGLTVVTGEGAVVRGGGKVVKNVAGYDLPKLFVGSYGTLGVIVEVTLKLRPVPDAERLVGCAFERIKDAGAAVRALMASDLIPNAVELCDAEAARALGLGAAPTLFVGFDGFSEQVDWQCAELEHLVGPLGGRAVRALPPGTWPRLGTAATAAFESPAAVMKLAVLPAAVAEAMEQASNGARQRGLQSAWAAHAGVGVLRAALHSPRAREEPQPIVEVLREWRAIARASGGYAVLEWAPLGVKGEVDVWDDAGAAGRIMQRIKARVDPRNILNPGRFVAGI